ncbi:MAG: hypothetical protein NUV61_02990 [Candidatus Azambacteria bacterium]|nr:hypothetical protein [Candidatus Azambacteria bacterium]
MGNNPLLHSQFMQPQKTSDDASLNIKAVYERFLDDVAKAKKTHREKISTVLRTIDERKIKDLKEKLINM